MQPSRLFLAVVCAFHPVYAIANCKNTGLKACGTAGASAWVFFDRYPNSAGRSAT